MTKTAASVLVVDDDPECLEVVRAVLSPQYEVRTATSVDQCRMELQSRRPDLIVLDVMMPNFSDGLGLVKELKADSDTGAIPVIMLTCVNEVYDYRAQIDESYFPHDRWLDKPAKPEVLLKTAKELLEPRQEK